MIEDLPYRAVWLVDYEFNQPDGEWPQPICLAALDIKSGRRIKLWHTEFDRLPPYDVGEDSLFCAYYASAEISCHLALNWPVPARILDLYAEFRCITNGLPTPDGRKLIGALTYFGLDAIGAVEKKYFQDLAQRGGPWSEEEWAGLMDYCLGDVEALARLLPVLLPRISLPHALLRGRYMVASARMERTGIPIDVPLLDRLRTQWDGIKDQLIAVVDADYGVFEGRTFKRDRFAAWLARAGIPWPTTETGQLSLEDETFRQMAKAYPVVSPLRELRSSLSDLRLNALTVGRDGRNRCLLSAFGARTSRNTPSNTKYIFGPSVWIRGLIKPPPGMAVAYVDWEQQEFGIAAALSGDPKMQAAYRSGDSYLAFAKLAGHAPPNAVKSSHRAVRELFKQCVLGTQYGQGVGGLANRIGENLVVAGILLRAHRETFWRFWQWSQAAVDTAMSTNRLHTVFGWDLQLSEIVYPRSLLNHPMQANGAEMLRLGCCLATERGVKIGGPVHDAVLVVSALDQIEADVATTRTAMAEASRVVLSGFELTTEATIVRYPVRYMDEDRGRVMWNRVMGLIGGEDGEWEESRVA
jgi:DNA polymerase I